MHRLMVGCLAALLAVGCSQNETQPTAVATKLGETGASNRQAEQAAGDASRRFLECVVRGDSQGASAWLTQNAAKRVAADPSVLVPLGFQVESLQIDSVRLLSEGEAAAECLLKESSAAEPERVCCLLKREASAWRVCGMACDAGADAPPVVISFEDPVESEASTPGHFVAAPGQNGSSAQSAARHAATQNR